jgi:transposase, IS6 family
MPEIASCSSDHVWAFVHHAVGVSLKRGESALRVVLPGRRGTTGRAWCRGRSRHRWVQRFTPLLADAARFARPSPGDRWSVDETYVNGVCRYVYRAVDQDGQVIDVLVSARRDADAARRFFRRALSTLKVTPVEVVTDKAAVYPKVLDELIPAAWHHLERWANNRIEADHSRLKQRLRPMRGLCTDRTATVIITGVAFMQNLRRGHYELAVDLPAPLRVAAAFTELARAI